MSRLIYFIGLWNRMNESIKDAFYYTHRLDQTLVIRLEQVNVVISVCTILPYQISDNGSKSIPNARNIHQRIVNVLQSTAAIRR